jgi:uncharacterized repeat protein (TIGR01451 family)
MDPAHRIMAAGTHGRGAFRLADTSAAVPALVLSKNDAGVPVGASSNLDYTIKLRNVGNADATGVTITDPLPANTTYVAGSADNGATFANGVVTWSGLSVPKGVPGTGGSITVHFRVKIADALKKGIGSIVNDGVVATSAEGPSTSGSPAITPIAPPYAVSLSPASQTDGARAGNSVNYHVSVRNLGSNDDSYTMSSTGGTYAVNFFQSDCTTPLTGGHTDVLTAGATADVCVNVAVPKDAVDGDVNTATVTATSVGSPSVSASGTVKTIAVTKDWLLVDNDGNGPDVQTYYTTALNTVLGGAGAYSVWDLAADTNLPQGYLTAHKYVVWFTGNSYPGPITPYEGELKALLDGGGNLFMNGQDILDQAAGTTSFVHDYLHITWDGSETQNDKATAAVHGVSGNPVTGGIGAVPLDHSVLGATFEDRITPNGTATPAFTDDSAATDALSFNGGAGSYKVVFLAFPMEAYGTAADKADLVSRVKAFFGG